jgi:ABC-2 type transport system permease protein
MQGDYLSFAAIIALGAILMFGFGMAIGGWAKNENQAAPLANLTAFPMMFLSGTFFPRFLMPEWLQSVSAFLPLTPLVDGIRYIIVEGKTLLDIGPQLALISIWIAAIYFVAFRVFRWE